MSTVALSGERRHRTSIEFDESISDRNEWNAGFELHQDGCAALETHFHRPEFGTLTSDAGDAVRTAAYQVCKRSMDIVISLAAMIVLSPVFLVAGLMIKLYDRGPVFFSQERVGKGGRIFRCFKFRSMILNAQALQNSLMEQSEHSDPRTFKIAQDPRITPPGRILRRLSIDELPQILNVLMGQMSIVGPRPPLPSEVALYSDYDFQRLQVKPGLTCIWQVSGRSRLAFPEQVRLDVDYINRRSLLLDLAIIVRTVPAVLTGDGAV